ncbi:HNH endonuclease [Prochlorococcus marinus]|uniref:HNH nuclease domain-containing protein n=1 Tax=Prochlorococcus marinus str. PAC1 TaxID=59924 RepID=A0A0A2C301_PROMR|nr:HNH endonuclease [Prochlorococcus marinus]KGG19285.1 hypothetical protein EV03_1665 [Prochlorococcus marinus str. PAC1]
MTRRAKRARPKALDAKDKTLLKRWRSIEFDPENFVLRRYYLPCYEIDLEKLNSWPEIFQWLEQIGRKNPMKGERELLKDFMHAIRDIFGYSGIIQGRETEWTGREVCQAYANALHKQKYAKVSPKLRYQILERDNFTCKCGAKSPQVRLEVDHIIPRSKGGSNAPSNLRTLCAECNSGKSDSMPKEHQEKVDLVKKLIEEGKEVPDEFWEIEFSLFYN